MILRNPQDKDSEQMAEIAMQHPFPIFERNLLTVLAVRGPDIIAVGQLIPQVEVLLMGNFKRSKAERVEALKLLMIEAMFQTNKLNIPQLHSFIKDEKFADILQKHWGFTPCAKALVLNL